LNRVLERLSRFHSRPLQILLKEEFGQWAATEDLLQTVLDILVGLGCLVQLAVLRNESGDVLETRDTGIAGCRDFA